MRPLLAPPEHSREPILTLPRPMTLLLAILFGIHIARMLLPASLDQEIIWVFGFVPARYETTLMAEQIPGGIGASIWSFLTYSLLHADLTHIGFNMLWMLPFGSALARRFGGVRFFVFLAITAVAGALAHLLTHAHELAPMIGASAAVSGTMAASLRFAFQRGSFLSFRRTPDADAAARIPALPLSRALRNGRVLAFLGIWFVLNLFTGLGAIEIGTQGQSIAWQAHVGGFLAGLLLFSLFDPVPRGGSEDTPGLSPADISPEENLSSRDV
ncbi:intramembrane serine protease GlpG [Afipia felis]|uniref:Intramembrane serine protease GlpG n=1 Tax=Afipia felis TaxID=1035 RepID=A0A090MPH7_AFIFE|nr:rhomboid family intramembrane serine protease [Afipia felis]CEG07564.1 intramembrane serine protease GlpG [Afipia felis]